MRKLKDLQLVFTSVNMLHYKTRRQLDTTIYILDYQKKNYRAEIQIFIYCNNVQLYSNMYNYYIYSLEY